MKTTTKIESKKSFKAALTTLTIAIATFATVGSAQAALTANGISVQNGFSAQNGFSIHNGLSAQNGFSVHNGLSAQNGFSIHNGLSAQNGFSVHNGLTVQNGLSGQNGLSSQNGLTPVAIWTAAGIDPNQSLSSSLAAR